MWSRSEPPGGSAGPGTAPRRSARLLARARALRRGGFGVARGGLVQGLGCSGLVARLRCLRRLGFELEADLAVLAAHQEGGELAPRARRHEALEQLGLAFGEQPGHLLALDRLVAVGVAGQHNGHYGPVLTLELLYQYFRSILFHNDLAFKVQAGAIAPVLVGVAGIAINATVLAVALQALIQVMRYPPKF